MKEIILGTAGHIDHGKTSLLKSLTGIDTDRLAEEKLRGISIDIGFAHMRLGAYRVGFIDVPGHEKFIKNMLAGVGGIQMVLLVVAADESIMPQTIEHLDICKLLGISRGVVVLTKKNLVKNELLSLVKMEIQDLLSGTSLQEAPIISVDSITGDGIADLKETLHRELRKYEYCKTSPNNKRRVFRLPIDRVFTIRGFGTVVTGTSRGSSLHLEDTVTIYPCIKSVRVRGIEIFNETSNSVRAGQRTALNLSGIQKEDLQRGMLASCSKDLIPSRTLDIVVNILPSSPQIFKRGSRVRFHHGTTELVGRIYPLEGAELLPASSTLAQLRLVKNSVFFPKDRFILRRYSPLKTIGGGIVLDNNPRRHRLKELPEILTDLKKLRSLIEDKDQTVDSVLLEYFIRSSGISGTTISELVARTGFLSNYLLTLLRDMRSLVIIPQKPLLAVSKIAVEKLKLRLIKLLSKFHRQNTLVPGFPREELKGRLMAKISPAYFQHILDQLQSETRISVEANIVFLHGQEIQLNEEQKKIVTAILKLVEQGRLQPPNLETIVRQLPYNSNLIQDLFYFLIRDGKLVRINQNLVLDQDQIKTLKKHLEACIPPGQGFTVGEFKQIFNISRKYAIPLLEYLDYQHFTQRFNNKRVIR